MYTQEDIEGLKKQGISKQKETNKFLQRIKDFKYLDTRFHEQHQKTFEKLDCLLCANCCKSISPIILQDDIDTISKHLGIKPSAFIQEYVYMDEEGDFVFNKTPCPFLQEDNYCRVYESRPKACREYPHTDRRKQKEIISLTAQNSLVCPAVVDVINELKIHPDFIKG